MTSTRHPPLNDAQLRTLRWIAVGCPDGVMTNFTYKVSALALQHRRLARVDRRQGRWAATITDAGRHYLAHGAYPVEPSLHAPSVDQGSPSPQFDPLPPAGETSVPPAARAEHGADTKPGPTRRRGPTEAMVEDLLQHEHCLEIALTDADRYEQLARAATRFKKVPDGMRVRVERCWPERTARVILEALPGWMTVRLAPIVVPAALRQPSDVTVQLRDREDLRIERGERNRALRLIEALVQEARRRGYTVATTKPRHKNAWGGYDRSEDDRGHVEITIGPDAYRLSVSQETAKVPHVATKSEQVRAGRGYAVPRFDLVSTPHLRLTIEGHEVAFWRSVWTDRKEPLEASLARLLQELELRHDRAEARRQDAQRQREERKRQWEAVRAAAVEQLTQAGRAQALQEQVRQWELASRIRAYVVAMEARLDVCSDALERQNAEGWIGWTRDYADRVDPLNAAMKMPVDPKPTPEALAPFMTGWSPYRPD